MKESSSIKAQAEKNPESTKVEEEKLEEKKPASLKKKIDASVKYTTAKYTT